MTTRGTGPGDRLDPAGSSSPRAGRGSKMLGSRAVLVSSASTVLFFAVLAVVVALAPGSEVVAERFFSPFHLEQSFFGTESTPSVAGAFLLNVEIFMISEVLILILALVIAVVRGIPGPVFFPFRLVAVAYKDLFRGIPLILVLYMIGFGVPGPRLCLLPPRCGLRCDLAGPRLLGIRRRGVSGRHRVRARKPERGGPFIGTHALAIPAV